MTQEDYKDALAYYKTVNRESWRLRKKIVRYAIRYFWEHKKWNVLKFSVSVIIVGFIMQVFMSGMSETKTTKLPGTKEIVYVEDTSKTMKGFLYKFGFMESGNNYKIKNQYGYMGRYQFGRAALTAIGMGGIPEEDFLNNPELQEIAMGLLLKKNKEFLARYIGKFQGRTIGGVLISESGLLAAAHMAPQGVIDFLDSMGQKVFKDGNGVPITKYFKELGGYRLEFK